jgi:hypothetical protein
MTDKEIFEFRQMNCDRYNAVKHANYTAYLQTDEYLMELLKKNAFHKHFKTKKEMDIAMKTDFNPFNTFSFGKCKDALQ